MMIYTKICSAFNFFIRLCWKSPFWLIADAKIQKITPSLKYLMEKEVLLAGDGMDFDEPRQTGAEEEVEEVKKRKGNEIQIRIKNPTSIFHRLLFVALLFVRFSLL